MMMKMSCFVLRQIYIYIFNCQGQMSKPSPYNRSQGYKRDPSPLSAYLQSTPSRTGQRQYKQSQPLHNVYTKYINRPEESSSSYTNYKPTQKKKGQPVQSYDLENILEKNRSLSSQNSQLYTMLEERGRIITALQKKLDEQMYREVQTLQQIQQEKNRFINDSHNKFKQYEQKIEELIQEIYQLNEEKYQEKIIKAKEIDLIKDNFSKQHTIKMHELTRQQLNYHEQQQEYQQNQVANLLDLKNKQIEQITFEYQKCIEQLKLEIEDLNKQIIQLNHHKKIELSEQKLMYDHLLQNMAKEHSKEREFLSIQHELLVKKLEQLLASKEIEANKLGELVKVGQIEKSTREQELLQKKSKLEEEIRDIQDFYKNKSFNQNIRLKELNYSEVSALQKGTDAIQENLKDQIANLIALNDSKTAEINKLHSQIQTQRQESKDNIKKLEQVISEQKLRLKNLERNHIIELQSIKVKWAELSQADILTLKKYYQGQAQLLQQQMIQKDKEAVYNRTKLHQQLQQKNQMRKRYDLQKLNLQRRITELQLFIKEDLLKKNQDVSSISAAMNLTSCKLLREATDKQRINLVNQQEKKKLQEIIDNKDIQIQELNDKIKLMRDNYIKEMAQKNAELQIIKKHHKDIEVELKKEKTFFDGELKKKDSILKNTKESYETQINIIKEKFKEEYDTVMKQLTSKIHQLEVEINRLKTVEKTLKQEIAVLQQHQATQMTDKTQEIEDQKERHQRQKVTMEDKLKKYYNETIQKLNQEISDLKKQLAYKEEDIRTMENKYYQLQRKMQQTMESQQQLRKIQENILAIGLDNNIVSNLVDLIKSPQNQ